MPELPEVETIRKDLNALLRSLKIVGIDVLDRRVIPQDLKIFYSCQDQTVQDVQRRGKAVILKLSKDFLVIQPMMTGQCIFVPAGRSKENIVKETKVVFRLSNGSCLLYNDQRLFGRLTVIDDLNKIDYFKYLGPEPLEKDFTAEAIEQGIRQRTMPIKNLLLDGKFVAGIGNIYASEILFDCRINPRRKARTLKREEIKGLRDSARKILKEAIALRGCSMRNYRDGFGKKGSYNTRIRVYGREDQPCPRCASKIQKVVLGQRSTFYCRQCQK